MAVSDESIDKEVIYFLQMGKTSLLYPTFISNQLDTRDSIFIVIKKSD